MTTKLEQSVNEWAWSTCFSELCLRGVEARRVDPFRANADALLDQIQDAHCYRATTE